MNLRHTIKSYLFTQSFLLIFFAGTAYSTPLTTTVEATQDTLSRIIFLSCIKQDLPQPLWQEVESLDPDLLLLIGDNVYADSSEADILQAAYNKLNAQSVFAEIRKSTTLMGTWDDHDFGLNDGGIEHQGKDAAQKAFLDFFEVPENSSRRQQKGIYHSRIFGEDGKRVQVIMLDTRYFRRALNRNFILRYYTQRYDPSTEPQQDMLGEAQWSWLKEQLLKPAEVRIIASSVQFLATNHGFEGWRTLPLERKKMFELIKSTEAKGVIFISGDRHIAELMKVDANESGLGFPLYDFTSSSFNQSTPIYFKQDTPMRVGKPIYQDNFASVDINWNDENPSVVLNLHTEDNEILMTEKILLQDLQ